MPDSLRYSWFNHLTLEEMLTGLQRVDKSVNDDVLAGLRALAEDPLAGEVWPQLMPMLVVSLSESANPSVALTNLERYLATVSDRGELYRYLADKPRAIEILVRVFAHSQFLSEILLRNPSYLEPLTQHKQLADIKSREQFFRETLEVAASAGGSPVEQLNAVKRYQRGEFLRIGVCDLFGLFDLRAATVQLSLLADSLVQCCLQLFSESLQIPVDGFVVLAFGKLGGEELNYSSDIDLLFLAEDNAEQFWPLTQKVVKSLADASAEGFFYRVDLRLRPWGNSGPLVTTQAAWTDYLHKQAGHWEKQALLKARPVAGDLAFGYRFLDAVQPAIWKFDATQLRSDVLQMKLDIEQHLDRSGRVWGEVKAGAGSIRDVEFVTQYLQLLHCQLFPQVVSFNTLDALVRLADLGLLHADEYRQLTTAYTFLRTVEHALQLLHHKQTHTLPTDAREQNYLARRLDYLSGAQFLSHYEQQCRTIRRIFEKYLLPTPGSQITAAPPPGEFEDVPPTVDMPQEWPPSLSEFDNGEMPVEEEIPIVPAVEENSNTDRQTTVPAYAETFSPDEQAEHRKLLLKLSDENPVAVAARPLSDKRREVLIVGYDAPGLLSMSCGLMFVHGCDILTGRAFTEDARILETPQQQVAHADRKFCVNVFRIRELPQQQDAGKNWQHYEQELAQLLTQAARDGWQKAQGRLAKRVTEFLRPATQQSGSLRPVEIDIDTTSSPEHTVLYIRSDDTIGFLYELANALTSLQIDIRRVAVRTIGRKVVDTLYVTRADGEKITDLEELTRLRAAVVLIKHFTHLLPSSPNPEAALLHFRQFIEHRLTEENWLEELTSLNQPKVLDALARLLGASDFLWEDFLRLQHENLFPIVKNVDALAQRKSRAELMSERDEQLQGVADKHPGDFAALKELLNRFKDREMFRIDMRHIQGYIHEFGQFSSELTDLAETVITGAFTIARQELALRFGQPQDAYGKPLGAVICALGKCGGRELGFASDIELMFVYRGVGKTSGPEVISADEYFSRLVDLATQAVSARQEGIFQIDLRLRPFGNAGSCAVAWDSFVSYFSQDGPAWPFERQALVKLRPIGGDVELADEIVSVRDQLIYTGQPFDVAAMHGMRQKQVLQHVQGDGFHAKLSTGGLVDCEYLVQGLQLTHGHRAPALRQTNTLAALTALRDEGCISSVDFNELCEAYVVLRRLIDALRIVRGNARDLTVPDRQSDEFLFLARRLGIGNDVDRLARTIQRAAECVSEMGDLLDDSAPGRTPGNL